MFQSSQFICKKIEKNNGERISALSLFSFMLYDFEIREFYSPYSITLYNIAKFHFLITLLFFKIEQKFFRHYFFLFFLHTNWLLEYFLGEYFFLNRKMLIFAPKRKNRHIFQGAISLIYWPILTNLGIKLIVSTRQIQWNNLQSNILKNKDFQFFVSFAHKNQFSHNFPSYFSAEKIRKNFF